MEDVPDAGTARPGSEPAEDHAAFVRTEPRRRAFDLALAPRYSLEAYHATGQALKTVARLAPLRTFIAAQPLFDLAHLEGYEDLARALRCVQAELDLHTRRRSEIPELVGEGFPLRGMLLAYAQVLTYKGTVAPEVVARIREGSGTRDLGRDLHTLATLLLQLPPRYLDDDAPVTRAEVERAAELANRIFQQVGGGWMLDVPREALLRERRKVAGLLLRSQAQLRRVVSYIRFDEGDAAELVPSLYVPRDRRR
ncbi:MAG: hypothetical protein H6738_17640 [Alphaproteobacteria bacterium]|nr:hypothetical protein [Alphaproteobacteria bacterium]